MLVSWDSIKQALIFFGPMLLPKMIAFYRSLHAPPSIQPQPVPPKTSRALNLLFAIGVIWLIATLPTFTPPNVFTQTSSRLQTKTAVLFNRLKVLTPRDQQLRHVFATGGLEARLQYLHFGPDVMCGCPLVDDAKAEGAEMGYLICALPALLKPHLLQLFLLGLATSAFFAGEHAARWRNTATITAVVIGAIDLISVATYDHSLNSRATSAAQMDNFFTKRHLASRLALCATDAIFGYLIWATATLRAFVVPPTPAAQLEANTKAIEAGLTGFRALGAVRNVVMRDAGFRQRLDAYWRKEGEMMQEAFEDKDVLEAMNGVLGRMDVSAVDKEAEMHVERILGPAVVPEVNGNAT